ncbi:hypothetical protein CANCADRAFT_122149 [Tortispora caseinolytica NRRL Y-17796]|uniref:Cell division control protein 14 n=1 Tax=Tortispora caseinolytica NRRL Y-17796 TaxID=767744 RepID=A0A1E4THP5_9ASCO|nr:hypothetical protein CANCADRAFT_122149 [Tortispora caseinolytica NRRL Y-17796]
MEKLLVSAFDFLLSSDPGDIRRGLRHIEGMLVHLCRASGKKNHAGQVNDPALDMFVRLQANFEYNLAIRLITCLEGLLAKEPSSHIDSLCMSALQVLQGVLLLHPPSRRLFARKVNMTVLLDLLEPHDEKEDLELRQVTVTTILCAVAGQPENMRRLEELEGISILAALFTTKSSPKTLKVSVLEFLCYYLMPETNQQPQQQHKEDDSHLRTPAEKEAILSAHIPNVNSITKEMKSLNIVPSY